MNFFLASNVATLLNRFFLFFEKDKPLGVFVPPRTTVNVIIAVISSSFRSLHDLQKRDMFFCLVATPKNRFFRFFGKTKPLGAFVPS